MIAALKMEGNDHAPKHTLSSRASLVYLAETGRVMKEFEGVSKRNLK
jgi:hypothetical protein